MRETQCRKPQFDILLSFWDMQPQSCNGQWKCEKSDNSTTKPDIETRYMALDSEGFESYRTIEFLLTLYLQKNETKWFYCLRLDTSSPGSAFPNCSKNFFTLPVPRQKIIKKYFINHVSPTSIKSVSDENDLLDEINVNDIINQNQL